MSHQSITDGVASSEVISGNVLIHHRGLSAPISSMEEDVRREEQNRMQQIWLQFLISDFPLQILFNGNELRFENLKFSSPA
ncbi:MAG: hypothetical protein AAGG00_03195 [Cyanobacteria bacterium P01_H01_bin.150]